MLAALRVKAECAFSQLKNTGLGQRRCLAVHLCYRRFTSKLLTPVKYLLLALLTAATAGSTALAQTKQSRTPGTFQRVQVGGGIDLYLTQGSSTSVVVEADNEVLSHLKTEVKGNALVIGWEKGYSLKNMFKNKGPVKVHVTAPRLDGLDASGGSDVYGQSTLKADSFQLTASGGSDITLALNTKTLTANASGGSDLRLSGRTERQTVSVSGGADYKAFGLHSTTAEVDASGAADANINVDGELSASVSGAADLRYKGNARVLKSQSSGGGSIQRAN